ncbi:MAG: (Fe-S)-binding protein [Deltaproteobacteria bacterium]|nr:(Fe-S)-binding protein [Deltaproteobacteria bacterium]
MHKTRATGSVGRQVDAESYQLCLYCPSLCRHACPVATAAETDTLSPQRLMSLADHVRARRVPPTPDVVKSLYGCAGCGACTEACRHDNPVALALVEARAALCEAGESPLSAGQLRAPRLPDDHPFFEGLRPLSRYQPQAAVSLVPGHAAIAQRPDELMDLFAVCERLDVDALACGELAHLDAGYDLWFAGHHGAFVEQARRFVAATQGVTDIVVHSPETLYLLRHVYPRFGLHIACAVVHVSEFLLPVLSGAVVKRLPDRIGYHESCHLKRHLGMTEVPRQLVRRVIAGQLIELPARADVTGCCGGSGLVPGGAVDGPGALYRPTAERMADAALEAAIDLGLDRLVSFSPECVAALEGARARRGGSGPRVQHAVALVAEAVVADPLG